MLPEWLSSWSDLLRVIVLLQGCWGLGVSLLILYTYLRKHPKLRLLGPRSVCILTIALGTSMQTFLLLRAAYVGIFGRPYIHWPFAIMFLLVSFALVDYGLHELIVLIRDTKDS